MASNGDLVLVESPPAAATPPPIAAAPPSAAATAAFPAVRSPLSRYTRLALLALAAVTSAAWFVEPFAAAADGLRLPWPAVVSTVVLLAALFYASVNLLWSFFLTRSPPAATAAVEWEGAGAIAVAITVAAVGISVAAAACFVAAGGPVYGYAPARC
ncbi:unnamed protein product [Urochloa decumbens]|uniref:Uncharacterized protein n=1 Tax=Urochloa decumbens TaxID=240449 RepID=A0ABC9EVQ4_9POAL